MKKILSAVAVVALTATSALANTNYTIPVTSGGVNYLCGEVETIDGKLARRCIRDDDEVAGALFGGGLSTTAAISLGLLTVVVLAAAFEDDDDTPTNGT